MVGISNLSLRGKLVWMQVLTSILVLGLCFAAFVYTDIKGYKEREVNNIISLAQVLGSNSISAIQFFDNETADKLLHSLQNVSPDIADAAIIDKAGNVFAGYSKKNDQQGFAPPYIDKYNFTDSFLYVYNTIKKNNEVFGTVCLKVELSDLEKIKKQNYNISILLVILGITLAFLIAIVNQRQISRPILSLVNVMKTIRESGEYDKHVKVVGRDEIAALSKEFNNLLDQVILSHQKKDEFIGIASHELKTPLTSIIGFLELLDNAALEEPNNLFVQKAFNGANKLRNLIFDLLDVSKIQTGQLQLDIHEFNLDMLINDCINEFQITTSHPIVREGNLSQPMINADRNRIEQVIINLLSNAIKYSSKEKAVIVKTRNMDSKVLVSVTDFGVGLDESEQNKIFDRYYRSKEKNIGVSGFGLGLYICAQIIQRHQGKIWVESENDKGSTFYFELPVSNASPS